VADLADKSGSVYSNIVNNNDDSVTFTVPNVPVLGVESVVATVDNSAAGSAATLTITIRDQDGQVIAQKAMPTTIPAADTGVATFAVGLDDAGASATGTGIQFDTDPQAGDWLYVETTGSNPATAHGVDVLASADINLESSGGRIDLTAIGDDATIASAFRTHVTGVTDVFLAADSITATATFNSIDATGTGAQSVIDAEDSGEGGGLHCQKTKVFVKQIGSNAAWVFQVQDALGNVLFQVDHDGSLHGKTGKSLVFDL
jgi:hypothetical protein